MDINRYLNLITSEHRERPRFISTLSAPLSLTDDVVDALKMFDYEFDLDFATGVQLNVLGDIVGVKRTLTFQPSGGVSSILDDETYRLIIKTKIAKNQWNGTIPGLLSIWKSIFPTIELIIRDNMNMTADIVVVGLGSTLHRELVENGYVLPKPEGVRYNVYYTDNIVFAFDLDNEYFSGFDVGSWL